MNILLGVTGSVATIITDQLLRSLLKLGDVKIVASERALHFLSGNAKACLVPDSAEWEWQRKGDRIVHIELRKWADAFVIAPCSANTLAMIANGLCDNLLTNVARCWNWKDNKRMLVAPAMNTAMWDHPATFEHLNKITQWGAKIIQPIEKTLACGDTGVGAMADVKTITEMVELYGKLFRVGCFEEKMESRADGS
jgi:phosphopantothenoylcysteine decarboxylase